MLSSLASTRSLPSAAFARLCWKEARQLVPFLCILVAVDMLLNLQLVASPRIAEMFGFDVRRAICFMIPCLFSLGCGPLLVSQEKEQKTLWWLSSIPIPPSQIVFAKWLVAVVGLIALWIVCGVVFLFVSGYSVARPDPLALNPVTYVLNSLFLLAASSWTAWRTQSAITALIAVIPIAGLVTMSEAVLESLLLESGVGSAWIAVVNFCLFGGVLGWWSVRVATQSLAGTTSPWRALRVAQLRSERLIATNCLSAGKQGRFSVLIWQFAAQNCMILWVAAISLLGLLALSAIPDIRALVFAVVFVWFVASWVGVLTFQSDAIQQRIRFLAERGVSPWEVWLSRLLIPFGFAVATMVVVSIAVPLSIYRSERIAVPVPIVASMAFLVNFAAAQWFSQWTRSQIVSLVAAVPVTFGALVYSVFCIGSLGTPLALLTLSVVTAFVATRLQLKQWMDQRTGGAYWAVHVGLLIVALAIPVLPFGVAWVTTPMLSSSQFSQLARLRSQSEIGAAMPIQLAELGVFIQPPSVDATPPVAPALEKTEGEKADASSAFGADVNHSEERALEDSDQWQKQSFAGRISMLVADMKQQPSISLGQIEFRHSSLEFLVAAGDWARSQLEREPKDLQAAELYKKVLGVVQEVSVKLRSSRRMLSQDHADQLDVWLWSQWQLPMFAQVVTPEFRKVVLQRLGDRAMRREARRRAIGSSFMAGKDFLDLRDFQAAIIQERPSNICESIAYQRRMCIATYRLLQVAEASEQHQAKSRYREFESTLGETSSSSVSPMQFTPNRLPGFWWHGDWEYQSEAMLKSSVAVK